MQFERKKAGYLHRNERKEKDTHPDFRGTLEVAGVSYWLTAYVNTGKETSKLAGKKYLQLYVQQKELLNTNQSDFQKSTTETPLQPVVDDFNDEIPF